MTLANYLNARLGSDDTLSTHSIVFARGMGYEPYDASAESLVNELVLPCKHVGNRAAVHVESFDDNADRTRVIVSCRTCLRRWLATRAKRYNEHGGSAWGRVTGTYRYSEYEIAA
jgi:hypothetical protein